MGVEKLLVVDATDIDADLDPTAAPLAEADAHLHSASLMNGSERDRIEQWGMMRLWAEIRRLARVYVLRVGQGCMLDAGCDRPDQGLGDSRQPSFAGPPTAVDVHAVTMMT